MTGENRLRRLIDDFRLRADTIHSQLLRVETGLDAAREERETARAALAQLETQLALLQSELQAERAERNALEAAAHAAAVPPPPARAAGPYSSVRVVGIDYLYDSRDQTLPNYMHGAQKNWAQELIEDFVRLADSEFYRGDAPETGLFLDIGGNIGTTAVYCAKKLKPRLRYIAFEPVEENARLLRVNCLLNGLETAIEVVDSALSSREDEHAAILVNEENMGGSGLSAGPAPEKMHYEEVRLTTLDGFLARRGIDAGELRYLWIDTEGHELDVLRGARGLLAARRIPLCIEFNQGVYRAAGALEEMLGLLGERYGVFYDHAQYSAGRYAPRPVSELPQLWDENEGRSCDLILL